MAFQPVDTLKNRTFIGLIVAQFLAGFNDQAIHASAMFYAIHQGILTEAKAISWMPILFFAPWAIFCTLAGYLADRYSKTTSLVAWKFSEILISLVALAGFILGSVYHQSAGAWMVMSTVFLMGTHAAFFSPAKYGAMPEILQPHLLSHGNGILESTTFLANILGTVTGGLLSSWFHGREYWIAVVLLVLSLIGAGASMMIASLPPANRARPFPRNLFKPLIENLSVLFRSRALSLAMLGIAFFVFMTTYMRACMYMHGETRVPRWDEFDTSLTVATVALGVGLGSPLAGYLSGGKVELGLVPIGCLGMIAGCSIAAATIYWTPGLVIGLIVIGFFAGFYMVPLYTLLQHRAPKTAKGDMIATSNFINVTGAMAASALFFVLVYLGKVTEITPLVEQKDLYTAELLVEKKDDHGRITEIKLMKKDGEVKTYTAGPGKSQKLKDVNREIDEQFDPGLFEFGGTIAETDEVVLSTFKYSAPGSARHYRIRPVGQAAVPAYDNERLPRYLFIGASLMTLAILVLLRRLLPDFFVRSLFWFRCLGRFRIKAVGMQNLPTHGPVILVTNCAGLESTLQLLSVTDRYTTCVMDGQQEPAANSNPEISSQTRMSGAPTTGLMRLLEPGSLLDLAAAHRSATHEQVKDALARGNLVALPIERPSQPPETLLAELRQLPSGTNAGPGTAVSQPDIPLVPVFCGPLDPSRNGQLPQSIRVVFGEALPNGASVEEIRAGIRQLGDWIRQNDDKLETNGHH